MITKKQREEFQAWMAQVNDEIAEITLGLTTEDISDFRYMDAFQDGASPKEVAREALMADDMDWLFFGDI